MVACTQLLISKGASVFSMDARGRYPALACAPNDRIAECLELIISQMMQLSGSTPRASLNASRNNNNSTNGIGMYCCNTSLARVAPRLG